MNRQECFEILHLEPSAGPAAIKQAYRRLAFDLHPDLNPNLPDAAKRFQELNEAYVLLMREYANTNYGARAKSADHSGATGHANAKTRAEARKAYDKARSRFGDSRGRPNDNPGGAAQNTQTPDEAQNTRNQYRKASREEILQNLLSDPFARRVFEDIYNHVRHNKGQNAPPPPPAPGKKNRSKGRPAGKPLLLSAGGKVASLAGNLAGGVKTWLRRQIDEDKILYLPGELLCPGARVRLQVRHGFSQKSRTVEFTLPPEFLPGRPIRLKGLGKRLGNLTGDLYLRVYSRAELEHDED